MSELRSGYAAVNGLNLYYEIHGAGRPLIVSALLITLPLLAQQRIGHDPLAPEEADKLRDTAMEPNQRIKLYVGFARIRMDKIDQLIADPKLKNKADQLHDLLGDFSILIDELADNVDMYHGQHWDIRKSLKLVIEGDSDFQVRLKKLSTPDDAKLAADVETYKFALLDATESLNNNADDARHTMQEQNELAKEKKLKKEDDEDHPKPKGPLT